MFWGTFFENLSGFEEIQRPGIEMFRPYMPDIAAFMEEGHGVTSSVICVDKIKHTGSTYTQQWEYLKSRLPKGHVAGAKLTLPAPEWYHIRYRTGKAYPKSVYANDQEYFADIALVFSELLMPVSENLMCAVTCLGSIYSKTCLTCFPFSLKG